MSSAQGRFTSPDPANAGAFAANPQSWNAYAYVVNNPLKYTDPHGLDYRVCEKDDQGKEFNCGDIQDDRAFEKYAKSQGWVIKGGNLLDSSGNTVGTAHWSDGDSMRALIAGTQMAAPVVNATAGATLGFMALVTGAGAYEAGAGLGTTTLIPGLAPSAEYTSTIRALDALGETSPNATLTATQARALAQNVVDVLRVTAVAAATKGGPYVESLRRQLDNPRFAFLSQIPGPL